LKIAGIERLAGDFFDAVDTASAFTGSMKNFLAVHGERKGRDLKCVAYLRIFGLSFSGK
jgi:hypothetical protein